MAVSSKNTGSGASTGGCLTTANLTHGGILLSGPRFQICCINNKSSECAKIWWFPFQIIAEQWVIRFQENAKWKLNTYEEFLDIVDKKRFWPSVYCREFKMLISFYLFLLICFDPARSLQILLRYRRDLKAQWLSNCFSVHIPIEREFSNVDLAHCLNLYMKQVNLYQNSM